MFYHILCNSLICFACFCDQHYGVMQENTHYATTALNT